MTALALFLIALLYNNEIVSIADSLRRIADALEEE